MNICRFVPTSTATDVITTLNFVYETNPQALKSPFTFSFYRVYLVMDGTAELSSVYGTETLGKDDLFFVFPAVEYKIRCSESFRCMYISFIGIRANMIMERLKVEKNSCVFRDMGALCPFWEKGIHSNIEVLDLISESVLLYTFSEIGSSLISLETKTQKKQSDNFLYIKKYIDENFTDAGLTLETLSRQFGYNEKYLSFSFKKQFKMGINSYINTMRINFACGLIDRNHSFVKDIAFQCGFKDQMYFSKVFKKIIGLSPREYIQQRDQLQNET